MTRALRLAALVATVLCVAMLLAAWQIPPHLDWTRYRGRIAAFASARMGRPVTIGGEVHLQVLPEAVLVADNVTLADRGDGVSAHIGALRLRVALGPLLRGRLVPRRLELDDPQVALPWPLPRGTATAVPARVAGGFSAKVEGGSLRLGGVEFTGINCGLQTDPDTGAFAAQGLERLGGLPWRFTALVGAPGRDGISSINVTLDGQEAALGTGATLRGRVLPGGSMRGILSVRGSDLSRLVPGPAAAWRVKGVIEAAVDAVRAPALDILLGSSPGSAQATLVLGAAPALDASVQLGQLTLDSWGGALVSAHSALPVRLKLSSDAVLVLGGVARAVSAEIAAGPGPVRISAQALLPGAAILRLSPPPGALGSDAAFAGHVALTAPDLGTTLAWLKPAAPALIASVLPAAAVGSAELSADMRIQPGAAGFSGINGTVDGASVKGSVDLNLSRRPGLAAVLTLERFSMPAALAGDGWKAARALPAALGALFSAVDARLDIDAAAAAAAGIAFSHVKLQADGSAGGLALHRLGADFKGGHLEASGDFARDGSTTNGRIDLTAADAAAVPVPALHGPLAGLWHGPVHLNLLASGPPQAEAAQLRADLGDLRAEAEILFDSTAPRLTATATIRHPGAPRLLAGLGVADGGAWLGDGSLAILTHLAAWPAHLHLLDMSVAAGALRAGGQGDLDFSAGEPAVTATIQAGRLTLPPLPAPGVVLALWALTGWNGTVAVAADTVLTAGHVTATNAAATVTIGGGAASAADISAHIAGGVVTASAAIDTAPPAPAWTIQGKLAGARLDALPALPGPAFHGGTADFDFDLVGWGNSLAALRATLAGHVQGAIHGAALADVDMGRLSKLLTPPPPLLHTARLRPAVSAALSSGDTSPLSGGFDVDLENGVARLVSASFDGPQGGMHLSGSWDVSADTVASGVDLKLLVVPAVANPPALSVRWNQDHRSIDAMKAH